MSTEYELHSRPVKARPLIEAVIGLANTPVPLRMEDVAEIIDMSEAYTRAVIQLGTELDLMQKNGDGYEVVPDIKEEARKMSPEQGFVLINRQCQRYNPFMTFISYLNKGFDSYRSAQTVKALYDIDVSTDVLEKQFLNLGESAELLDDDDIQSPNIEADTLPTTYVDNLQDALTSEANARLFVLEKLSEEVVAYADDESIEKFQEALLTYKESPDNAIVSAVVAAENITRELATDEGSSDMDYSKANGIGSLAKMMRGDDLILKRHLHGANYLGSMRIPGAHGKESETLESWQVEPEVSLEVIISAISYVRSLYYCVREDQQVL